ncbi:MAG: hypothetical protein LBH57_00735 [Treponema sp.]|jgi:hypothetical protein|nr:hypothetical protein [Treponema sp.]
MAKKENAIYAPGELDEVRKRLGNVDDTEAKRVARLLGGEVGVERKEEPPPSYDGKKGGAAIPPKRRIVTAADEETAGFMKKTPALKADPRDNPSILVKVSYRERIKMDNYAGQAEFDIKNFGQVVLSVLSFFSPPPDYLNARFVTKRMNEYYRQLENLVVSTRTLFPRNNLSRNERLKKVSAFAYAVLDTIRQWNIERISAELTRLQARPRNVKAAEFSDILRFFYRPLFILDQLDLETHITESYKLIYKINFIENPQEADEKHLELIHTALSSLRLIRQDIRFLLYPLLMKLLSDQWFSYKTFFSARKNRYLAFIGASDADQIPPADLSRLTEIPDEDPEKSGIQEEDGPENDNPEAEAKKAKLAATEAERKAVDKGLQSLEILFPKAGWDRLPDYPDLYPYFRDVFSLKKEYALIAPTDPLLQTAVFARILEELLYGLRYVSFGVVTSSGGNPERVDDALNPIINNWHYTVENSFDKEYLPRLSEYCRILENTAESRTSSYARRLLNELHWIKRLYFLPYYKFESAFPPPFQKQDISPLYPSIRQLRRSLTAVAAGIERGNKMGGAEKRAPCDGIDNPWEHYEFQVPNPVSKRLNALLGEKKKNNASLIFFTLAVTTVADSFINNDGSWAYNDRPGPLFRSINGEGVTPSPGVDTEVNAEAIFKQSLKTRGETT